MTNEPGGGGGAQGDDVTMRDMAAKHQRLVVVKQVTTKTPTHLLVLPHSTK